jgi:class 3 adenylate cyclase
MRVEVGERRIVSVLVADVAGSTALAEQLGPERSKYVFDEIVVRPELRPWPRDG